MIFLLVLVNIFIENDTLKKIFIFKNSLLRYIVIKCRNIQLRRWRVKLLAVTLFQFAYHKSEVVITLLPLTPRIFIELKLNERFGGGEVVQITKSLILKGLWTKFQSWIEKFRCFQMLKKVWNHEWNRAWNQKKKKWIEFLALNKKLGILLS